VFLVAPPILINRTTEAEWFRNKLIHFNNELRRKGFNVLGGPFDYRFPPDAFYNTEYHLECGYARQRASILAKQLGFVASMEPP
jgi:hypothetical protein